MKQHLLHPKLSFRTVRDLVEWAGEQYSEHTAFSYRRRPSDRDVIKISFNQFRRDVRALACSLLSMGCAGKHCALIGKTSYEYILVYYASLCIGAIPVPLDQDWHLEDLVDIVCRAEVAFLFCDEERSDTSAAIAQSAPHCAAPIHLLAAKQEPNVTTLLAKGSMMYAASPEAYHTAPVDPDAAALLVFTSGTTGQGKGVLLSQTALLSDVTAATPYIDYSEKTINVLPPHHTYGSTIMFLGHVAIGSEVYISSGLRHITKEMKEQAPGHLVLVPLYLETFYRRILAGVKEQGKEEVLAHTIRLSNLLRRAGIDRRKQLFRSVRAAFGGQVRTIISGGAPINQEILDFFDAIGISVLNGYGITECAPLIAFNRSRNIVRHSVGNVIDIDQVKIHAPNEDGEGEICVKGPNVMLGYFKDAAATAAVMDKEGYFHTGDYGRLDSNGILYITGRKKNLIILSNGKNVYPEEIENELISAPGVLEVVVYEGKSKQGVGNHAIVAEIFPDHDYCEKNHVTDVNALLKAAVDSYNRTAVPYKKVQKLKIRSEEFPKNTLRKIQRHRLDTSLD